MKEVLLVTFDNNTIVKFEIVSVKDDWQEFMGPYCDFVPFSVGGNQQIWDISDFKSSEEAIHYYREKYAI